MANRKSLLRGLVHLSRRHFPDCQFAVKGPDDGDNALTSGRTLDRPNILSILPRRNKDQRSSDQLWPASGAAMK